MKRIVAGIIYFLFLSILSCSAQDFEGIVKCNRCESNDSVMSYGEYIRRLQYERAVVYNALNLSDEQIQIYEDMIATQAPYYERAFKELLKEDAKLKALKTSKAGECEVLKQRRVVKKLKNNLEKQFDRNTKSFKKCLNSQQRAKYSMIKKLQHDDIKKAAHKKDYYKANPQLSRFGNPEPCSD